MRRSIFCSFACIDLKFCKQPPDHCRIINHGLDLDYKVLNCACADLSFFKFCIYRLETYYTASFLFRPQFRRLGYAVSTLKYMETARLLYWYVGVLPVSRTIRCSGTLAYHLPHRGSGSSKFVLETVS